MTKKIIALFCAAILLLGLFSACVKQNDETGTVGQDTSAAALRDYGAWEGEWSRMDTGANTADITITNARAGMFDFSFLGMYVTPAGGANTGELEGAAHFTGENKAVFEYDAEYRDDTIVFGFVLEDGRLLVSASENVLGLFGMNVAIDGIYEKRGASIPATPAATEPESKAGSPAPAILGKWFSYEPDSHPNENTPTLTLNEDGTFHFYVNLLEGMGSVEGSYEIYGDYIECSVASMDFRGFLGDDVTSFALSIGENTLIYNGDPIGDTNPGAVFRRERT